MWHIFCFYPLFPWLRLSTPLALCVLICPWKTRLNFPHCVVVIHQITCMKFLEQSQEHSKCSINVSYFIVILQHYMLICSGAWLSPTGWAPFEPPRFERSGSCSQVLACGAATTRQVWTVLFSQWKVWQLPTAKRWGEQALFLLLSHPYDP